MMIAEIDDFSNGLAALQKRWDNRITGRDIRVIGKSYGTSEKPAAFGVIW